MNAETLGVADIRDILRLLPHRYPFLMVDRVIDMRGDEHAIGIKNITFNEPHFLGHFPDNPVMPGVLVIEGMAQTAGVLCLSNLPRRDRPRSVFFLTIDKAKFRKPAVPGDTLEYHVDKIAQPPQHVVVPRRGEGRQRTDCRGRSRRDRDRGLDGDRCDRARRRRRAYWRERGGRAVLRRSVRGSSSKPAFASSPTFMSPALRRVGEGSVVYPFSSLGTPPQSVHYRGGPTRLVIGARCELRESVTMNTGTEDGGGITRVGDRCFFMVGSHVGHDCDVGNDVTFANNAVIGGHVSSAITPSLAATSPFINSFGSAKA